MANHIKHEQASVNHMLRIFLQQREGKLKGDENVREQGPCAMRHRGQAGGHQA